MNVGGLRVMDLIAHRRPLLHSYVHVELMDCSYQRWQDGVLPVGGVNHYGVYGRRILVEGIVHSWLLLTIESAVFEIRHYSNDLLYRRWAQLGDPNSFADGVLAGKILLRKGLIDYHNSRSGCVFCIDEVTAGKQLRMKRVEVSWADIAFGDCDVIAVVRSSGNSYPIRITIAACLEHAGELAACTPDTLLT
jgi:hypothetical protein